MSDLSGHGNNGTITNATWTTTGKFGKALVFNGASARHDSRLGVAAFDDRHVRRGMGESAGRQYGWKDVVYKGNDNYYLMGSTPGGRPAIGITVGASQTEAFGRCPLPPIRGRSSRPRMTGPR